MSEWATLLSSYMVDPSEENASYANNSMNYCLSAAIGGKHFGMAQQVPAGTTWWGASCRPADGDTGIDTDAAWAHVYAADAEQKIMQDDMTEKGVWICEFQTIVDAFLHDLKKGPLANGVWIAGKKHTIARKQVETGANNEYNFIFMVAAQKGEKGHIVMSTDADFKGKACIITAEFDKSLGCTSGIGTVFTYFCVILCSLGTHERFCSCSVYLKLPSCCMK
ncbi:unnamed protein product [Amoebophrya sp. A120]|nr:unnamed protein product [Amoebophrya sp. A120]|eukprot:GSA120T00001240001.1